MAINKATAEHVCVWEQHCSVSWINLFLNELTDTCFDSYWISRLGQIVWLKNSINHLIKQALATTYWWFCHIDLSMTGLNKPRNQHKNKLSKIWRSFRCLFVSFRCLFVHRDWLCLFVCFLTIRTLHTGHYRRRLRVVILAKGGLQKVLNKKVPFILVSMYHREREREKTFILLSDFHLFSFVLFFFFTSIKG